MDELDDTTFDWDTVAQWFADNVPEQQVGILGCCYWCELVGNAQVLTNSARHAFLEHHRNYWIGAPFEADLISWMEAYRKASAPPA